MKASNDEKILMFPLENLYGRVAKVANLIWNRVGRVTALPWNNAFWLAQTNHMTYNNQ